jgi:EmrB/QacA subfamily drug resistance transporter
VLCVVLAAIGIDETAVNVALPTLSWELSTSATQLQWIVESYLLVIGALVLTAGALSDRYGRRLGLVLGLLVFGAASAAGAFAPSADLLITARVAMGIGAAMIMPSTLSIVRTSFPEKERRLALGIWTAVLALGVLIGPFIGGFLLEHFWWGSVFLINVPITAVAVVGAFLLIEETKNPSSDPLDLGGAVIAVVGMGLVFFGITEAPRLGWADPVTLASLALGGIFLTAFVLWERGAPHPMLDLSLFRNPRFSAASLSLALAYSSLFGAMFILTQYLQFVLTHSPLEAGLRIAPLMIAAVPASLVGAVLAARLSTRAVVVGGLLATAAGLSGVASLTPTSGYASLFAACVTIGLGIGAAATAATDSILSAAPEEKAGAASAVDETAIQLGSAFGIAALGGTLTAGYSAAFGAEGGVPQGISPNTQGRASESIGDAVRAAAEVGGTSGEGLLAAGRDAFVEAMSTAMLLGAGMVVLGALVALAFLPARVRLPTVDPISEDSVSERRGGNLLGWFSWPLGSPNLLNRLIVLLLSVVVLLLTISNSLLYDRYESALQHDSNTTATQPNTPEVDTAQTEEAATFPEQEPATTTGAPSEAITAYPAEETSDLRVAVRVVDTPTWLVVQEDGQITLEQESQPGFLTEFEADQEVSIWTGNAGATWVEVNGHDLGPLGASGEFATRTFTVGA